MARGRTRADLDSDRQFNLTLVRLLEIVGEQVARTAGFAVRVFSPGHGAIKFVRADRRAFSHGRLSDRSVCFVPPRSCWRIRCSLIPQGGTNLPGG